MTPNATQPRSTLTDKDAVRWNDGKFVSHMERLVWNSSPVVREYLHLLISGHPYCDWVTFVEHAHLPPRIERALVLGCGSGWLERGLSMRGRIRSIVACDVAPEAVNQARMAAESAGLHNIEYRVLDLERAELGSEYDAIFAHDVLHHISDLEGLFERINRSLVLGGVFLFNEYVGPNRFQYSNARMDLVNRYFRLIPDELRLDHSTRRVLWRRERCDAARLMRDDPTEAVRSEDLLAVARSSFETLKEYPYGGGLLNPLLYGIIINFEDKVDAHDKLLRVLCGAEARLTANGEIDDDFRVYVGRRSGSEA